MTSKQAAIKVVKALQENGYQALLAGGCVRDMIMDRQAEDYDVATDAKPEQVIKLFRRTLKVGAKFGVVIVMLGDKQIEVATFRAESDYADGRHPESVHFCDARQDALRRDFTINGMFYDPVTDELIDYVNGREDLEKKTIRTIGDADERFSEDYLRMLRAVRFSTQLGFAIDAAAWEAIGKNASKITGISGERICAELEKTLVSPNRAVGAEMLIESSLAERIFPGFDEKCDQQAIKTLAHLPLKADFFLALAAFFAGCESDFACERAKILRLSRNQSKHLKFLLVNRGKLLDAQMPRADLRLIGSEEFFDDLFALESAIQKAQHPHDAAALEPLKKIKSRLVKIPKPLRPEPLVTGDDLIAIGAKPSPALGRLLNQIYRRQLEGQITTKGQAIKSAQEKLKAKKPQK